MARTRRKEQEEAPRQSNGSGLQNRITAARDRIAFMETVQETIRTVMTQQNLDHNGKVNLLMERLIEMDVSNDDLIHIMMQKKGLNTDKHYFGFTIQEMQAAKENLKTLEMLAPRLEGREPQGFAAREEARRVAQQNQPELPPQ